MSQSTVTPPYKRYVRSFFLTLCLLQSASYACASEDLKTTQRMAEQGNAQAQLFLGVSYANGRGVAQDYQQSVAWFRKAAEQGNAQAQFLLGASYAEGQGVAQDARQSVAWLRKAAEQGNAQAQTGLGFSYATGEGVPQDNSQEYAWFSVAAANGESKAADLRNHAAEKLSKFQLAAAQKLAGQYFEQYQPRR